MGNSSVKILTVDDEEGLREVISEFLELEGYTVETAENGLVAWEKVQTTRYHIVVTDLKMPKSTGLQLAQNIKTMPGPKPRLILMTAFSDLSPEQVFALGFDEVLGKPFKRKELVDAVSKILKEPRARFTQRPERFDCNLQIAAQTLRGAAEAHVINIGRGGMFIASQPPYPLVGDIVKFSLGDGKISGSCVVRWIRDKVAPDVVVGYGAEFLDLNEAALNELERLIKENLPEQAIPNTTK